MATNDAVPSKSEPRGITTGVYASEAECIADLQKMLLEAQAGTCKCRYSDTDYERLRSALETIAGPEDGGRWIGNYREAGGGYAGLQAVAKAVLGE